MRPSRAANIRALKPESILRVHCRTGIHEQTNHFVVPSGSRPHQGGLSTAFRRVEVGTVFDQVAALAPAFPSALHASTWFRHLARRDRRRRRPPTRPRRPHSAHWCMQWLAASPHSEWRRSRRTPGAPAVEPVWRFPSAWPSARRSFRLAGLRGHRPGRRAARRPAAKHDVQLHRPTNRRPSPAPVRPQRAAQR